MSDRECRRILGVSAEATPEAIRQAYLDLARVWHPDRFQSDERLRQIAQDHFCEVNEAFAVLKRRGQPEPASNGGASVAEDPPPARPDSGRPPKWTSSRTQWPAFRRPRSLALVSRFVSNKVAYTTMVTVMVALPFVGVCDMKVEAAAFLFFCTLYPSVYDTLG